MTKPRWGEGLKRIVSAHDSAGLLDDGYPRRWLDNGDVGAALCAVNAVAVEGTHSFYKRLIKTCESPIEEVYAVALWVVAEVGFRNVYVSDGKKCVDISRGRFRAGEVIIEPQFQCGDYRIDFRVTHHENGLNPTCVLIECDGHDYHERTKEQAAADRSRDRALTTAGWKLLRFTGSEIWRDPIKCAEETLQLLTVVPA